MGWAEIFKNLFALKKPVLGAMTEVHAIQKLDSIGIKTTPLIAYGQQGCNPASMQSFVMTEDLGDIVTVEELCGNWQNYCADVRQSLMKAMAELASQMHRAGLCHRDFYLCHFVIKKQDLNLEYLVFSEDPVSSEKPVPCEKPASSKGLSVENLHLIDLHRMMQGQARAGKAVMKDIAGLYFSALQAGLTAQDLSVFKQYYLPQNADFWVQVESRAQALLNKFNSHKFQQRLQKEKSAIR